MKQQAMEVINPVTGQVFRIPGWFEIDVTDRDNFMFHMQHTPAMEAYLNECIAEVERDRDLLKLRADTAEYEEIKRYKTTPMQKQMKNGVTKSWDVTDEMCKALARTNPAVVRMREQIINLQKVVTQLKGYSYAFQTKKSFLSSLAGITRTEMQQFQGYNQYDGGNQ